MGKVFSLNVFLNQAGNGSPFWFQPDDFTCDFHVSPRKVITLLYSLIALITVNGNVRDLKTPRGLEGLVNYTSLCRPVLTFKKLENTFFGNHFPRIPREVPGLKGADYGFKKTLAS